MDHVSRKSLEAFQKSAQDFMVEDLGIFRIEIGL